VTGELYVGGVGVARGYHGRPALTAERFVPSPFGPPGSRLYRTGDLARRGEDCNLVFHGRADAQIKIRGMRVEPAEIESALLDHPDVRQVVVVARGSGGSARLVAYLLAEPGSAPQPAQLRAHLADRLPLFMIPHAFAVLDAFPKNAHGKVDRSRLPEPADASGTLDAGRAEPRTDTERRLVGIWQDVLGRRDIGVEDDFFAAGGSSLKFAQIAARIREELGIPVELRALFTSPTIAGLAALLEDRAQPPSGDLVPAGSTHAAH
jgi:acyl carrier protein